MSNFGTMRNRILDDLNRTDLSSQAENAIKTAIDYYQTYRFWFQERRSTTNTTSGQEYYPVPSDFLDDDSLVIDVNGNDYPLHKRTYQTLEEWSIDPAIFTSQPTDYAIYGTGEQTQIRLYPAPNGAYTMTLSYVGKLDQLTTEASTNSWMTTAEELIRSRAEASLFAQKLRDYDAAQACKFIENEALNQLQKLTKQKQFTGRTRKRGNRLWA